MNHILRLAAFFTPLLACAGCTSQAAPAADVVAAPIHLEAEDGQLTGAQFQNKGIPAASSGVFQGECNFCCQVATV